MAIDRTALRGRLKRSESQRLRQRQGRPAWGGDPAGVDALVGNVLQLAYQRSPDPGQRLVHAVLRLSRAERVTLPYEEARAVRRLFSEALKQMPDRTVSVQLKRVSTKRAALSLLQAKRSLNTTLPNRGGVQLTITPASETDLDVTEYSALLDEIDVGDSADEESGPVLRQLERSADARRALMQEFPLLTSRQVAEFADSGAKNRASTAHRWATARKVFSVSTGEGERFPAFEFKDGSPRAVNQAILNAFEDKVSGWALALWFISGNGWLDGDRPVDVLDRDPNAVVRAAERSASEIL